jgi:UDP:flavonoid glycosyltransferase YjiC (YdhE family)
LLPTVALAVEAGHRVTFAGQAAVVPRLEALGFATMVVGPDTLSSTRRPLVPVDRAMEQRVARDHFVADFGALRADQIGQLIADDRPHLVVCDEMDAGAVIAAELAGVPCVTVSVLAAGRLTAMSVVGTAWHRLRADHGLAPDPSGARFAGTLRITPAPASFRDPSLPAPFEMHHVRPPILDDVSRSSRRSTRPLVYATLGTVFDVESGDLFTRLVHALSLLDVESVLTIGSQIARAELPPAPDHVRIEPFIAQRELLGDCTCVVCHGGTGTIIAALSVGVPAVVIPMGADQPDNADRCDELGAGIVLDAMSCSPAEIVAAVRNVHLDARFTEAARRLAVEAAGQPRITALPALLELF